MKTLLPSNIVKMLSNINKGFSVYIGRVQLSFLVVSVGQACNFKCRDCANFAPISPDSFRRYDVNDIKSDLAKLFENIKYINLVQIQGGEPFLYSDLIELLNFLQENKSKVHEISIATNGSIIPQEKVLECLKKNDVLVRISDYGISEKSCSDLLGRLSEGGIRSYIYSFGSNQSLWFDCGNKNVKYEDDKRIVRKRYHSCVFKDCLTLERGELSYCSRSTNSYVIQGFTREYTDYFNLRDTRSKYRIKLAKYLVYRHPMQACCYCNGTDNDYLIPPAIQM